MTEYVGQKPLFDQYLELKAENERLRKLVAELPKCCSCGGIIKPDQGGQCMPCLGEETLPDSAQETEVAPAETPCPCDAPYREGYECVHPHIRAPYTCRRLGAAVPAPEESILKAFSRSPRRAAFRWICVQCETVNDNNVTTCSACKRERYPSLEPVI